MKNLKRTIPAALATVGLLAGGVAMATPAAADDPTWSWSAMNQSSDHTLQVNAFMRCNDTYAPAVMKDTIEPLGLRGETQPCTMGFLDVNADMWYELGTPAQFAAGKQQRCKWFEVSLSAVGYEVAITDLEGLDPDCVVSAMGSRGPNHGVYARWLPVNNSDSTFTGMLTSQSAYPPDGQPDPFWPWTRYEEEMSAANGSVVNLAADVTTEPGLGDATPDADTASDDTTTPDAGDTSDDTTTPDAGDTSDDTTTPDAGDTSADTAGATVTRAGVMTKHATDHQVIEKHQTRVKKMATKVHRNGGLLTVHAYGPDEALAIARAAAVVDHLEEQLTKRGHVGETPIYVTYAGNPDHKKDTHTTIHWHPDTTLPNALPGSK